MRLVRCGLFVLVLVVGTQLNCVSSQCSSYLSVATTFPITLSLTALITWIGLTRRLDGFGEVSQNCRMVGNDRGVSV